MALITCKECGQSVSDKAASCPKCGAPIKKSSSSSGCMWMILVAFILFVVGFGAWAVNNGPATSPSKGPVNVGVGHSNFEIQVTNKGTRNWPSMTVYINGHPPDGFKYEGPAPAVGEKSLVNLREFSNRNGEWFDPIKYKVTAIWVGGSGYDYQGWKDIK